MIPSREEASKLVEEYRKGKSVRRIPYTMGHVNNAAYEAYKIAAATFHMDHELTYVDAVLHDISRLVVCDEKCGIVEFDKHRHPIGGYQILNSLGYEKQARIAIMHALLKRLCPLKTRYLRVIFGYGSNENIQNDFDNLHKANHPF